MEELAAEIAHLLGGEVSNPEARVNKLGKIECDNWCVNFLANVKYEKYIYSSEASVADCLRTGPRLKNCLQG